MSKSAIFFDMDGVIVDSEPEWQAAEINVFAGVGVTLTIADCLKTQGMRIDEAVQFWFEKAPWKGPSTSDIVEAIVARMEERLRKSAVAKEGAVESMRSARQCSDVLAIVSSSPKRLIRSVIERLQLETLIDFFVSGQDVPRSKPDPSIYVLAAKRAGVASQHAWVVEDSVPGVIAAKAAGMHCVVLPEKEKADAPEFLRADLRIDSLLELDETRWGQLFARSA